MPRSFLVRVFPLLLIAVAVQADDSAQFQFGGMYAQHIRGVGLYAGYEAQGPYATAYIDGMLLASDTYDVPEPLFGGVSVGLRTSLDVALSPYVGVGLYVGENEYETAAGNDKIDNDEDGIVDEAGESQTNHDLMAAVYPEAGWNLKLGNSFSVRVMSRYMVSSFGRKQDDWFYGLSFALATD